MHHFAHKSGATCEYGYETSLHLAAKEILSKTKEITIPAVYVHFPDSLKKDELICESKKITLDHIEVEHRLENIIPDLIVHSRNKVLLIEIYATHAIDETKLKKIKALNISTIEINLKKSIVLLMKKIFQNYLLMELKRKSGYITRYQIMFFKNSIKRQNEKKYLTAAFSCALYVTISKPVGQKSLHLRITIMNVSDAPTASLLEIIPIFFVQVSLALQQYKIFTHHTNNASTIVISQ